MKAKNYIPRWNFNFLNLFLKKGSIHGLPHVSQRRFTLLERFLWLVVAFVALYFSIHLALESLDRYRTKSTVISIERDYHYWNNTLPSITICPLSRLSKQKFEAYCRVQNITGTDKDELFEFLESLANSTYFNFNNIRTYPSIDKRNISPNDYIYLIYNLTDDYLKSNVIRSYSGESIIYSEQILTEWGICYSTNSYIIEDLSTSNLLFGKPSELTSNNKSEKWMQISMNAFDAETPVAFLGFPGFIEIYIHGAYEVMAVERRRAPTSLAIECEVEVSEITASDDFAKFTTVEQRQCRFPHESNLTHFPIYTRNLCQQECRINLAYKLCKCIPHFYPNRDAKKPVCHYKALKDCLFKYAGIFENLNEIKNLSLDMDAINCYCLPNCRSSEVIMQNIVFVTEANGVLEGNGAVLNMKVCPHLRMQRQIIFTLTDLLVSIGGTAGFFLGSSILSAVEILYFFTIRFIWHLCGYNE